jgi:hypothetical protein
VEAESLEPPRGSRAQVSLEVEAVRDNGSAAIQASGALRVELLQREVDRARKVAVLVLVPREHVEQLRAFFEQAL